MRLSRSRCKLEVREERRGMDLEEQDEEDGGVYKTTKQGRQGFLGDWSSSGTKGDGKQVARGHLDGDDGLRMETQEAFETDRPGQTGEKEREASMTPRSPRVELPAARRIPNQPAFESQ
jgi:hypothetical protein